jgi:cytochrome c oxidase subunit IV
MILIVLTLFTFLMGWLELTSSAVVTLILITTFAKAQLVIDYFMGLREVKFGYRVIPTIWLLIVISCIALAYFLPVA